MTHVFIINTKTLGKKTLDCFGRINAVCDSIAKPFHYTVRITDDIEQVEDIVKEFENTGKPAVFYSVGGDGTFHNLINKVDLAKYPVQMLPFGTGDDIYRYFYQGKPFDLRESILNEEISEFDLGSANGEFYVNCASIGLDANIASNYELFRHYTFIKKSWRYYLSIFYTLLKDCHFNEYNIECKNLGEIIRIQRIFTLINVANGPYEGGGIKISPHADARDERLNVIIAEAMGVAEIIKLLLKIKSEKHIDGDMLRELKVMEMIVSSSQPFKYQLDGEVRESKSVVFKVHPNELKLKGGYRK